MRISHGHALNVNLTCVDMELSCSRGEAWVVSNRWTGLWTGSLDWIAGLDCWIGF